MALLRRRLVTLQFAVLLACAFVIFAAQAQAVIRFTDRSLLITSAIPGATTNYTVSLTYNNEGVWTTTVGSIDLLFCIDPIPQDPCVAPAGLDVSNATLANQTGETGFTILRQSANEIVLTRTPTPAAETPSTYTFDNIVNPTDTAYSFSIRLSDYPTTDASGQLINLGSVVSQVTNSIVLETQVPPILIFCLAQYVSSDCSQEGGGNFIDLGEVDSTQPLEATSEMAVSTNASNGFVITANGPTMEAGTHVIPALSVPTASAPGNNQFGINLTLNTDPAMGAIPTSGTNNAVAMPNYDIPNDFTYNSGDEVAEAASVSLDSLFTVSYIINTSPNLSAGVYTTTITYICSGRF